MRWTRPILGGLLILTLAALPAMASAQPTATPATPVKTSKAKHLPAAPTAAKTASPKMPAERVLPPAPPLPPALSPAMPSASTPAGPTSPRASAPSPMVTTPPAAAPTTPAAPASTETPVKRVFPYAGYLSGDTVNVRSGPGLYYYPVVILNKDVPVTVVESDVGGWLALKPANGACGLMRKSDLTLSPDGKSGTVSISSARVYASGPAAKRHWAVMATLRQGDAVKVLGPAEDEMVRITAPEGSRVYVVEEYVTAGGSISSPAMAALANLELEPPKPDPLVEEFQKVDAALKAEMHKAVPDRQYDEAAARYKEISGKTDQSYIKRACAERVAYIGALQEQQKEFLRVVTIGDQLDQRLAEIKAQRVAQETAADREKKVARADFLATGLVAKLESLADVDYPIKFKLVDQNNRPVVLLKSTAYDLSKYAGKIVGVRGTKTYLKEWQIYLVTVDDMEVLEQ